MNRFRVWIVTSLILAAGAGLAGGMAIEHFRDGNRRGGRPHEPGILRELNLTDAQKAKILPIWEEVLRSGRRPPSPELLDQAREELESKLDALLTEDQRKQYRQYQADYDVKLQSMRKSLDEVFGPAEQQTRELLTPEQQKKFDEIRERMRKAPPQRDFGGGRGRGGPGKGPGPGGPPGY